MTLRDGQTYVGKTDEPIVNSLIICAGKDSTPVMIVSTDGKIEFPGVIDDAERARLIADAIETVWRPKVITDEMVIRGADALERWRPTSISLRMIALLDARACLEAALRPGGEE